MLGRVEQVRRGAVAQCGGDGPARTWISGIGTQLVQLLARPRPAWTVARAGAVMRDRRRDLSGVGELPELAASWRADLRQAAE